LFARPDVASLDHKKALVVDLDLFANRNPKVSANVNDSPRIWRKSSCGKLSKFLSRTGKARLLNATDAACFAAKLRF
jgi:hypothetical protein